MRITKIFATLPVFALLLNLATTTPTVAATSEWKNASEKNSGAKVRILSSFYKDDNQQKKLVLGLHFNIENGWHVYGNEAGGIGMPPSLDFKGSTNYKNHKIFWPKAISKKEVIGKETIKYSVYENEVILPVEISLKNAAKPTNLKVKVNYGLCKDICIPASSEFAIDVDNAEDSQSLQEIQKFFEKKIFHEETVSSAKNNEVDEDTSSTDSNQTVEVDNAKHYFPPLLSAIFAALIGGLILLN
jgi:DsbC/DsbD-like thiol-disulfide interchange protein